MSNDTLLNNTILNHIQSISEILCRSRAHLYFEFENERSLDITFTLTSKKFKKVKLNFWSKIKKVTLETTVEEFNIMTFEQIEEMLKLYLD